ncbi:FeoB-associated Cys-rich membrane protein [Metabacillus sp. GX 13764]|uniref:FeoB-associated Cys-rich membrane protein n=1 Tax=Metabacillus kandeliae TaxID=2900151 RepID=UPI001E2EF8E6|nr:FeoB-associated Cys-rich membrane protein [Metabacillus kandeliae]MCD7035165.1 FeoB-associated Cys-rich membrane protein [Metabacillus kandeliae]
MLVSILIGVLIFGYAGYTIFKHIQKSKMGKCASCELNKACSKQVCTVQEFKPEDSRSFTKPDAL